MTCIVFIANLIRVTNFSMSKELLYALPVCFPCFVESLLLTTVCTVARTEAWLGNNVRLMAKYIYGCAYCHKGCCASYNVNYFLCFCHIIISNQGCLLVSNAKLSVRCEKYMWKNKKKARNLLYAILVSFW